MKREKFQIYEDPSGKQFLLIEQTRVPGVWTAVSGSFDLCFLSEFNLQKLQLIGHAHFKA